MQPIISTYCGLVCETCDWREKCNCSGCVLTKGNPFHGNCPVAQCCIQKEHAHCGECASFPCELLTQYSCDPVHGDIPPGARIEYLKGLMQEKK